MIAALAAGVLGQIEGLSKGSAAISGLSSLFSSGPPPRASGQASPATGRAITTSTLSDQLQALLLHNQATQTNATGTIQADDLGAATSNIG